jgi:eukaryotic-like serine/threonine-protein kinase
MLHDLQPGDPRLIGPYQLHGVLGAGGMGRVFLGASAEGRLVAVKVIHAGLAADPAFQARFRREIEVARKVSGSFTAPVLDADLDGPAPWLATAYVAGPSLAEAVADHGPLPPASVLKLATGLAEGLAAIHDAGVVHRDLKPSNVLLAQDGPRLIDFGISAASGATALTNTGVLIGSPGFMSPEQAEGLQIGPPSDIFSLGAVLTFASTGEGPFGPGSTVALIYRVIHRPPDLDRVPKEVRGLVERCLVKDPALRPTARNLLTAMKAGVPVPPVPVLVAPDLPPGLTAAEQAPRRPTQGQSRRGQKPWRRRWRPLAAAAVIAGVLGTAVTADLTLSAAHSPPPAAQSERQVTSVRPPPTAGSTRSPSADPRRSQSAAGTRKTAAPAGSTLPPAGTTPSPAGTAAPAASTAAPADANPPAVSSTRPSPDASPTRQPYPSPSASPSPSVSPSPSAYPSSTTGGY